MTALSIHSTSDTSVILNAFLEHVSKRGLSLYPAQEEAILEVVEGNHVILNTPTGSGKSLVALAMHYKSLCMGRRSVYTCPIKALVSEKFFALCKDLGAHNVGMLTGDATINRDAPVLCCTAEILSNASLSEGDQLPLQDIIMDEFHYYSDRDRGHAWQIPLLTLPHVTYLLMSATLGDCRTIIGTVEEVTRRKVSLVTSAQRPVPLDFVYRETPLHETLADVLKENKSPVYVVNFTQRQCVEEAQNALSTDFAPKEQKQKIAQALQGFKFDSPFGKTMRTFIMHGIGVHHAGLLPKYRLLVEKLAQEGLLKIIMGTDTLGVGVNVPIRSVLFTQLCKFDGEKTNILTVRDFKQIAGRAGRKGYDDHGWVLCQAPAHVIENKRMENRAEGNPAKMRKLVKKKPPTKNYVPWDAKTFDTLITQAPETMQSRFQVTHSMLLEIFQGTPHGKGSGYKRLVHLIHQCHDSKGQKTRHKRHAKTLFKSLRHAGIVTVVKNKITGNRVAMADGYQTDFSLNQALSLYLIDTLPLLDPQAETYALDILTLVESILENPGVVLQKQIDQLRDEKFQQLKMEGVEFEARLEELDKIEHPKPNRDFIYETFNAFAEKHPWVGTENIQPKSIARDMVERCASFHEYIREYGLERSEGVLLRYLSQVYKTLRQSVPEKYHSDAYHDTVIFLRITLGRVDSSLVKEWEELLHPQEEENTPVPAPKQRRLSFDPRVSFKAFSQRIRTEMHAFVKALSLKDYAHALTHLNTQTPSYPWEESDLEKMMAPFFEEHGHMVTTPVSRKPEYTLIKQTSPTTWDVQQVLLDPQQENVWSIHASVHWNEHISEDEPCLVLESIRA
jgi:hypothetical protein